MCGLCLLGLIESLDVELKGRCGGVKVGGYIFESRQAAGEGRGMEKGPDLEVGRRPCCVGCRDVL